MAAAAKLVDGASFFCGVAGSMAFCRKVNGSMRSPGESHVSTPVAEPSKEDPASEPDGSASEVLDGSRAAADVLSSGRRPAAESRPAAPSES